MLHRPVEATGVKRPFGAHFSESPASMSAFRGQSGHQISDWRIQKTRHVAGLSVFVVAGAGLAFPASRLSLTRRPYSDALLLNGSPLLDQIGGSTFSALFSSNLFTNQSIN